MPHTLRVTVPIGSAMGPQLLGVDKCPYCSISDPNLQGVWASAGPLIEKNGSARFWGAYKCETCAAVVIAEGTQGDGRYNVRVMHPSTKVAHEDIPSIARTFLQQAFDTLHAPDAAAVMAGSAVDAMLKAKGYADGSLYSRIDAALANNLLTAGMAEWAHSVRLGSNRPRHADEARPHVTANEARQSVEFAEALGSFLFVLTARIDRGIEAAKEAERPATAVKK